LVNQEKNEFGKLVQSLSLNREGVSPSWSASTIAGCGSPSSS
jgi:hypothetical protein